MMRSDKGTTNHAAQCDARGDNESELAGKKFKVSRSQVGASFSDARRCFRRIHILENIAVAGNMAESAGI
jgi:hypothetical protein